MTHARVIGPYDYVFPMRAARPHIVTLCGSMRFFQQMLDVAAAETAAGRLVLAPFCVVAPDDQDGDFKAMLDELHRRKIDLADEVIVVTDTDSYVGESTSGEIAYATKHSKPVRYAQIDVPAATATDREQVRDLLIAAVEAKRDTVDTTGRPLWSETARIGMDLAVLAMRTADLTGGETDAG